MASNGRAKGGKVMSLSHASRPHSTGHWAGQNSTPCKRVGMEERNTLRRKQQEKEKAWERFP